MRALLLVVVVACGNSSAPKPSPPPVAATGLKATIRWTSYGIPHVEAADLKSLAFGQAYAVASQNICVIADQIVKVRSERARYFGPEHADSDFGWLALDVVGMATELAPKASADARAITEGYAAGYNKFLDEGKLPVECAGKPWVKKLAPTDLVAYWLSVGMIGSSGYFVNDIARAQPPSAKTGALESPAASPPDVRSAGRESGNGVGPLYRSNVRLSDAPASDGRKSRTSPPDVRSLGHESGNGVGPLYRSDVRLSDVLASNGWGIGGDRTVNGKGMLVANPHFPWEGELRFSEAHLTIPGQLDAYGAQLLGLPLVGIGFTAHHAWTHTFSASSRFVLYRLTLDPADPTKYRYGDETKQMTKRDVAIEVLQKDGSLVKQTRTFYRSHYGPIVANDRLAWSATNAFAIRDVTRSSTMFDQYIAMIKAKTLDEFKAAYAKHQTTPFLNTMYADAEGNAWYIDGSAVPDLSQMGLGAWQMGLRSIPELKAAWNAGVIVLDGGMPMFELAATNTVRPGAIPTDRAPQMTTRDYVMNANDSYWLTNPKQLLTGSSPFYGEAEKQPSARTRMNHRLIDEVKKFTHDDLKKQILSNRALTVELWRPALLAKCKQTPALAKPCGILEQWDGTFNTTAKGAALWREWFAAMGEAWTEPYDAKRPLETPQGLKIDKAMSALTKATDTLLRANIDPAAPFGDVQYTEKGGKRFGVPGTTWAEGGTNPSAWQARNSTLLPAMTRDTVIGTASGLTPKGYPVNYGSSFILAVSFDDKGPRADALLTYSQSTDPASPHANDQTALYAKPDPWRPVLFTRAAIDADPALRVQEVSTP